MSLTPLSTVSHGETVVQLPHPYLTAYTVQEVTAGGADDAPSAGPWYRVARKESASSGRQPPVALVSPDLRFTEPADLKSSELPSQSNNGPWARARRSPSTAVRWAASAEAPTLAQAWLLLYILFTIRPSMESLRLDLAGPGASLLAQQLKDVLLAVDHPPRSRQEADDTSSSASAGGVVVLALRSTFWQGAGSPFGPRPVWCPDESPASLRAGSGTGSGSGLGSYPLTPVERTITVSSAGDPQDPDRYQQSLHPVRPAKPAPGAVIYSRYIPHLAETFSMVSLDWEDQEHLRLFHEWQNDPRVSQGWNETGTLEQHREYLRRIHVDPHQVAVLAKWDDAYFAYFEIYWAKEDRLGGYFDARDFDRGRHSLVGDVRFRGPHRVTAWWSSLIHYLFLDDPRTDSVVGEPKDANSTVVMYDLIHGFGLEKFVDLPHKRSALVRLPRERFFQLCPLGESQKAVGGMKIGLVPKL